MTFPRASIPAARTANFIRMPVRGRSSAAPFRSVAGKPSAGIPFCSAICYQIEHTPTQTDEPLIKIPSQFLPVAVLILVPALVRLMPYILGRLGMGDVHDVTAFLWNFSPVSALFLFGGAKMADRRTAYLVPLAAMLLSDLGIAA